MGCILPIVSIFMPRVVMVFIWLLTHWFSEAFKTAFWPLLGFLFMPYTTLAYMGAVRSGHGHISLLWLIVLIIAVLWDLGGQGGSFRRRRRS